MDKKKINSSLNIIGSLPSFEIIYDIIRSSRTGYKRDLIVKKYSDTNLFNKRTEESRLRIIRAIENSILIFANEQHKSFIFSFFNNDNLKPYYDYCLFLHLLVNNNLFYQVCQNVFLEIYYSGRLYMKNEDVVGYLYHLKETEMDLQNWTDSTIKITSSKILTLLKKVNLLEGKQKKEIKHITLSYAQKVLLICMILSVEPELNNILESKYVGFFFTEKTNLIPLLKDLKLTEYFDIYSTSNSINIKAKNDIEDIINAVSN